MPFQFLTRRKMALEFRQP